MEAVLLKVKPELLSLFTTVGAKDELLTLNQVFLYLRNYISNRVLYDDKNRTIVKVANDPLGRIFGVSQFVVKEIPKLLIPCLSRVPPSEINGLKKNENEGDSVSKEKESSDHALEEDSGHKRKGSDFDQLEPSLKKPATGLFIRKEESPMYLQVLSGPEYDSSTETTMSVQGFETASVKDSSDDLWFLEDSDGGGGDTFSIEYEVLSDYESQKDEDSDSSFVEDITIGADIAFIICKDDSDIGFWADDSSNDGSYDSDPEISNADKWKCENCGRFNKPHYRNCERCWEVRDNWLPEQRPTVPRKRHRLRRSVSAPSDSLNDIGLTTENKSSSLLDIASRDSEDESNSNGEEKISSSKLLEKESNDSFSLPDSQETSLPDSQETSLPDSQEGTSSSQKSVDQNNVCRICYSNPKNATLVHGISSHMCCFPCGKKLKRKGKPCPFCRRTIQKVIHSLPS